MATEIMMIRTIQGLVPATEHDHELVRASYKLGQPVRTSCKRMSNRSLQHHRLYFGGLIGLVKDYWEPQSGLIHPAESITVRNFCAYLQHKGIALSANQINALHDDFFDALNQRRIDKLINPVPASTAEIHRWIKIECGYFDVIRLPNGAIEKVAQSISFAKMTQGEFNEFYKVAFGVCWRFVLSRHFDNEADADNAINSMLDMAA